MVGDLLACGVQLGREIDQILFLNALMIERCGLGRMRLGRRIPFARRVACRHLPLFDRPNGRSRHAIEHEHEALLGDLRDGADRLAVDGDVDQIGGDAMS